MRGLPKRVLLLSARNPLCIPNATHKTNFRIGNDMPHRWRKFTLTVDDKFGFAPYTEKGFKEVFVELGICCAVGQPCSQRARQSPRIFLTETAHSGRSSRPVAVYRTVVQTGGCNHKGKVSVPQTCNIVAMKNRLILPMSCMPPCPVYSMQARPD